MPELEDYFREKRELADLKDHPGWKRLDAMLAAMVFTRNNTDRSHRIECLDDAFRKTSFEGEISGIQLARICLDQMLEAVQANIDHLLARKREEEEEDEDDLAQNVER